MFGGRSNSAADRTWSTSVAPYRHAHRRALEQQVFNVAQRGRERRYISTRRRSPQVMGLALVRGAAAPESQDAFRRDPNPIALLISVVVAQLSLMQAEL
jgi:hypothetical protein